MQELRGEIQEIGIEDVAYPQAIRELGDDAPKTLYAVGDVELLKQHDKTRMCILGARRCSQKKKDIAADFIITAIYQNCVIVNSGGLGIDTSALWEAVNQGAKAIVFLGSIKDIYPKDNFELYQKVIDLGGVLVSPNKECCLPAYFRERTKLMMAFTDVAFVVEAGIPSGTFAGADDAYDMGKAVWAYPGSSGCNELIRHGATLVSLHEHLYIELQNL